MLLAGRQLYVPLAIGRSDSLEEVSEQPSGLNPPVLSSRAEENKLCHSSIHFLESTPGSKLDADRRLGQLVFNWRKRSRIGSVSSINSYK